MRWGNDLSPQERLAALEKQFARVEDFSRLVEFPEWLTFVELLGILRSGQDALVRAAETKKVDYRRGRCAQIDEIVAIVAITAGSKDKLLDRLRREKMRLSSLREPHDGGPETDGSRPESLP